MHANFETQIGCNAEKVHAKQRLFCSEFYWKVVSEYSEYGAAELLENSNKLFEE